jgi:hypothetical protein
MVDIKTFAQEMEEGGVDSPVAILFRVPKSFRDRRQALGLPWAYIMRKGMEACEKQEKGLK